MSRRHKVELNFALEVVRSTSDAVFETVNAASRLKMEDGIRWIPGTGFNRPFNPLKVCTRASKIPLAKLMRQG
ncbi:hypothetical protein HYQ46_011424 [Verticillium longisporum]|nr:hypothetical protein HYQ46_011424 [Verticillium longisporum]